MSSIRRIELQDAGPILDAINRLLPQLSFSGKASPITVEELRECLNNKNFHLFAAEDVSKETGWSIVGLGSVFFQRNLGRWIAEIHDIVVDSKNRGKGLGEKIVTRLIEEAANFARSRQKPITLYLTSRSGRVAANRLYVKLGFVLIAEAKGKWGTNLYKLILTPRVQR